MSFSFTARGTRSEVIASLDALTDAQLGQDPMGRRMRNNIIDAIEAGVELDSPSDQRYSVNVTGHSGPGSVVSLIATIQLVKFPYEGGDQMHPGAVEAPVETDMEAPAPSATAANPSSVL